MIVYGLLVGSVIGYLGGTEISRELQVYGTDFVSRDPE